MTLALVAPVQPGLPPSCHWTLVQWLKTFAMSHRRTRSRLHRRTTRGSPPTEESLIGLFRSAEDAVVAAADGAAAVAVAGGEVDGAVGAVLDLAQAAVFLDEERLGVEDSARVRGIQAHAHQTLADQAGEEEVALKAGSFDPVTKDAPEGAMAGVNSSSGETIPSRDILWWTIGQP